MSETNTQVERLSRDEAITRGFQIIGRALIDLRYAQRTTDAGEDLLVLAGALWQGAQVMSADPLSDETLKSELTRRGLIEPDLKAREIESSQFWLRSQRQAASAEPIAQPRLTDPRPRLESQASCQSVPRTAQQTVCVGLSTLALASLAVLLRKSRSPR